MRRIFLTTYSSSGIDWCRTTPRPRTGAYIRPKKAGSVARLSRLWVTCHMQSIRLRMKLISPFISRQPSKYHSSKNLCNFRTTSSLIGCKGFQAKSSSLQSPIFRNENAGLSLVTSPFPVCEPRKLLQQERRLQHVAWISGILSKTNEIFVVNTSSGFCLFCDGTKSNGNQRKLPLYTPVLADLSLGREAPQQH